MNNENQLQPDLSKRWDTQTQSSQPTEVRAIHGTSQSLESHVLNTFSDHDQDQQVHSYDESFREAIATGGSIYGGNQAMIPIIQAAHERRMQLLDRLPIGDVSDKVIVDYGVGSWGFACIYPKLQYCAQAIGIDISYEAIKASATLSEQHNFPYGKNYKYLTSRGDNIELEDHSVDIFFAGECIEHVENTDAFLDEIHRVLQPGGLCILTTPNAEAPLFRCNNERYGVGPEHVALMGYSELCDYIEPRFKIIKAYGFNGSLHHSWDEKINNLDFARAWANQFEDRPDLGTGVVLLAQRRDDYHSALYQQQYYYHNAPEIHYEGHWEEVSLHKTMQGRLGANGDANTLTLDFEGTGIIINFWTHAWSGYAFVEVDGIAQMCNLYSHQGGFNRIHIDKLAPATHRLRVYGSGAQDPRSQGNQIIIYQIISYQRIEKTQESSQSVVSESKPMEQRPSRFGAIYTAPILMTWSERVVLYSTIFGLRPQRCLEIGTHKGGSSLIISSALDDIGTGYLVCVDPHPLVAPELWQQIDHHATLLKGTSPEILDQAVQSAGGTFDFAFIDGDHEFPGVVRDIEGVLPVLAEKAYLLFHDAHYYEVTDAIEHMIQKYPRNLTDCGMVSVEQTPENRSVDGRPVVWGGLRMVRYCKS